MFKPSRSAPALRALPMAGPEVLAIAIDRIIPQEHQHRTVFGKASLTQLSDSIRAIGIIAPLVVRPVGDLFAIVCGERRYRAALALELSDVPAIVIEISDADALVMGIQENVHREDLLPIEEARAYRRLIDEGIANTQNDVAAALKVSNARVSKRLALLALAPGVVAMLESPGSIFTERHLRLLMKIQDASTQTIAAAKIVRDGMSAQRAALYVAHLLRSPEPRRPRSRWTVRGVTRFRDMAGIFRIEIRAATTSDKLAALKELVAEMEREENR